MPLDVGIVGLPGAGKTTLFTALTGVSQTAYGQEHVGVAPEALKFWRDAGKKRAKLQGDWQKTYDAWKAAHAGLEKELQRRMRAQANFIEHAPFFLILLGALELSGANRWVLAASATIFAVAVVAPFIGAA